MLGWKSKWKQEDNEASNLNSDSKFIHPSALTHATILHRFHIEQHSILHRNEFSQDSAEKGAINFLWCVTLLTSIAQYSYSSKIWVSKARDTQKVHKWGFS